MNDIDWWNTIIKVNILGNNNISFYVTYNLFGGVGLFDVFVVEVVKFNRLHISLLLAKQRGEINFLKKAYELFILCDVEV